jgi:hypothetical protein
MSKIKPTANASIAYAIDSELKARTNLFATNGVTLGAISEDPLTVTVDFTVKLNRRPCSNMGWVKRNLLLVVGGFLALHCWAWGFSTSGPTDKRTNRLKRNWRKTRRT